MRYRFFILITSLFILSSCGGGRGISLHPFALHKQSPQDFTLCHGFGCRHATPASLSDKDWADATRPLRRSAATPAAERKHIAQAVARMERTTQKLLDLEPDRAEAQSFEGHGDQMDCLDETINTSRTLQFFERAGLLKHHEVGDPVHRGYFLNGRWPHNSASITEIKTGDRFVIDSYYSANGETVHVIPLKDWLAGWRPDRSSDQ